MGIETKYDYIYYTVLNQDWFDEAERILNGELTTDILVNVIERKLKNNNDWTLNDLKVDYSQRSEDIEYWINKKVQHKERPVFVQLNVGHPIITSGSGTLFVFYEEQEKDDDESTSMSYDSGPDGHYYGGIDGLAGAGGRL
tara:strand:- start:166 stop:588 length:423 start_codon:yes stop_codon:yes gene_type:complete